ncbi:MAG: hypothetical protein J7L71_05355, partial [Spirochaetaceae bacterium]|nr:hypothetical protein [Spirochaetaceae bacterium]
MLKLKIFPLKYSILITIFFTVVSAISASPFNNPEPVFPENTEIRQMFYDQMTGNNKVAQSTLPEWRVIEETGVRVNFFTTIELHDDGK